jgi:hypothetical protein
MKTDELIAMMASGVAPVDRRLPLRQMVQALTLGAVLSLLLMLKIYGLRPDLGVMLEVPMFWIKLAFPSALAVGAMLVLRRLMRPGLRVGATWAGIAFSAFTLYTNLCAIIYPRRNSCRNIL